MQKSRTTLSPEARAEQNQTDREYFSQQLGTQRGFLITWSTVTEESAVEGEEADGGWQGSESCEPGEEEREEGWTAVGVAVRKLKEAGATFPSSWPGWGKGTWYSTEPQVEDYSVGETVEYCWHPQGWTADEEREIFKRVVAGQRL